MILWINGAFGSGKTQTAGEICRRLEGAFLYDPENVGFWLRRNEPEVLAAENFQDEPLWRSINRDMLLHLAEDYRGTIVVPMTLVREDYYDEIIGALRRGGVDVRHFVLHVRAATLRRRLRKRLEGSRSWAARQIPVCVGALESPVFENKIPADSLSIPEAAEEIARRAGLDLGPRSGPAAGLRQRLVTQMRAIRK